MDPQTNSQLTNQTDTQESRISTLENKIDKIYTSVEKTRKMILWTGIITVALFVLPLIGLLFAIPTFLQQFSQIQGLGL